MLSRTADSLFWMARYMERAEQMARLIDMGRRMSATPCALNGYRNEWPAVLSAAGVARAFFERQPTPEHWASIRYLMLDRENPSSVIACFEAARANARAARGAISVDMWQAVNDAWIEVRKLRSEQLENGSLSPLLDWVKERAGFFRGAVESSVLRNDGYEFLRLGMFVERLDNTARLLDVKTYMAARRGVGDEGARAAVDEYEWTALLRAAGGLRAYHMAYRSAYSPEKIVEFLTLNAECPRSLAYCAAKICECLQRLEETYDRSSDCHPKATAIRALIAGCDVRNVRDGALSATLSEVIRRNNALSGVIADTYYFAPRPLVDPAKAVAQADDQADSGAPAPAEEPELEIDAASSAPPGRAGAAAANGATGANGANGRQARAALGAQSQHQSQDAARA